MEKIPIYKRMRCILIFTFILVMGARAEVYSQQYLLNLPSHKMPLAEVFSRIESQTGLKFLYNASLIESKGEVKATAKQTDLRDVLTTLLNPLELTYILESDQVIVKKAETPVAQQQAKEIRGVVKDEKGQPLPGVTVAIKGANLGVVTDMEGNYLLRLPQEARDVKLLFSFVGMKTQEVAYAGQQEIDITMHEEATQMDEVVITGYQTIDRRKNTSSVTSVKMDDIMVPGAASLDQMLEGRVPDMILMTNSGEVGVAPKIRIRGTSTLIGNREPLWVVDGIIVQDPVPVSAEELNDPDYVNRIGNAIAGINPQDIERIDVLKDAAATALYGTKAANGVIVVTTKKGRVGKPVISYNMSTTFRQRPRYSDRKINLMDSKERIQLRGVKRNVHE